MEKRVLRVEKQVLQVEKRVLRVGEEYYEWPGMNYHNLMNTTSNYVLSWWKGLSPSPWTGISVKVIKSKSPPIKLMLTAGQIFVKESEELTLVK